MSGTRLKSIDIFRALTMLLMIYVNDLWTLSGIPEWLGHKAADADGLGLADVVFPAFLFIVGLSIPHAIRARLKKGASNLQVFRHILERTFALLVMGLFMVNLEYTSGEELPVSKGLWQILMALGFFLIWNTYRGKVFGRIPPLAMKGAGWGILVFLAVIYRGPAQGDYHWMQLHWWGILGLIGWGYLLSALAYLLLGNRPGWIVLLLLFLLLLNVNEFITPFRSSLRIVVSASNYVSVMCGMLVSSVMIRLREKERESYLLYFLLGFAILLLLFGFLSRPQWGISKIRATPSWTTLCAAISCLSFAILYVVADRLKLTRWADIIEAAGSSTLTCYLVPYYVYPLAVITGLSMPAVLTTGIPGLLKTLVFSVLIIQLTGLLGKAGIRLKI
jgi:heparan-alpha-glucosaminide N-acetyltransferase